jgi:hypothetical protein
MKKIFIALSVLVALAFGAIPSMAVEGTVDDVLSNNVTVPFFLISRTPTTMGDTENTLVVIHEMGGLVRSPTNINNRFHGIIYSINSAIVFDWNFTLTPFDAEQFYVHSILELFGPAGSPALAPLEVTVNGQTFYAGYIIISNVDHPTAEHVGSWVYQVALSAGRAAAAKLPSREYALGALVTAQGGAINGVPFGLGPGTAYGQREYDFVAGATTAYEGWSANALAHSQERALGIVTTTNNGVIPAVDVAGLGLQPAGVVNDWALWPRYYLLDPTGETFWFIWLNTRLGAAPAFAYNMHVDWWNETENMLSTTVSLDNELNIIDVRAEVPASHITGSNDFGMARFRWQDPPALGYALLTPRIRAVDMVVYSYQMAAGPAAISWNVLERGFVSVGTL